MGQLYSTCRAPPRTNHHRKKTAKNGEGRENPISEFALTCDLCRYAWDGDFFNYLEKFQKQTEQLRHHLDPSAAPAS
jgi:hypothetical protein